MKLKTGKKLRLYQVGEEHGVIKSKISKPSIEGFAPIAKEMLDTLVIIMKEKVGFNPKTEKVKDDRFTGVLIDFMEARDTLKRAFKNYASEMKNGK